MLALLLFLPCLLLVPLHHLFEFEMLSDLLFFFLFLIQLSLFSFLFQSAPCKCLGVPFLVVEYGFVVDVLDVGHLAD